MTKHLANNYKLLIKTGEKIIINRANGSKFYDINNNSYIDGTSSYCSANLGHNHLYFKKCIIKQMDKISICPRYIENEYLNNLGIVVNKYFNKLIKMKETDILQILPSCNGVDTIETAIKLSRAWGYEKKGIPIMNSKQIFFDGNFHGRSISAISVSNYEYQKKFYPKVPNLYSIGGYNDIEYLENIFNRIDIDNISAIFIEPIQCEGGINILSNNFLIKLRYLCDKYDILLICDEIQTGLFRTGKLLCSSNFDCKPDIILLGKSLGGGYLPISLTITSDKIMNCIKPGEHGSTFGGNPLASYIATEVLEYLHNNNYEYIVNKKAKILKNELDNLMVLFNFIKEIRSYGLLYGIEIDKTISSSDICNNLINQGIIIKDTQKNTLRLSPPFIINNIEIEELIDGLYKVFNKI
jgi:ornithine--oxo-acid transaminase